VIRVTRLGRACMQDGFFPNRCDGPAESAAPYRGGCEGPGGLKGGVEPAPRRSVAVRNECSSRVRTQMNVCIPFRLLRPFQDAAPRPAWAREHQETRTFAHASAQHA
jgi:hypothetical protein